MEALVKFAIGKSKPAAALKLVHNIANGLVKARMESKQPPKVCFSFLILHRNFSTAIMSGERYSPVDDRCKGR